jgi:hypothetical protein
MLDADLAHLYGVGTKRFNEAFKRNSRRFPVDFAFQLTAVEFSDLRSQIAISSAQRADQKSEFANWSQFTTSSASRRGKTYRPWAFTEHGALMAANILRSEQAVRMSVYVIRSFVRLREVVAANSAILKRLAEIDRTLLQHDTALRDIYRGQTHEYRWVLRDRSAASAMQTPGSCFAGSSIQATTRSCN